MYHSSFHTVAVHITNNTFVRYREDGGSGKEDSVGMVVNINAAEDQVTIRCFFSWLQLVQQIDPLSYDNVSFWKRRNSTHPPFYLCDSDITTVIPVCNIHGLAFIFHESDNMVRQLDGMVNTFVVTSIFLSRVGIVKHIRTFSSFPSQQGFSLPSCCSSMIFEQMMRIKGKMQLSLNTRSLNSKNVQTIHMENINRLTWHYMTRIAIANGLEISSSYGTVKATFMEGDTCVVQKWRDIQESFSLNTPHHFHCAKLLFGTCVGLGIRVVVPLSVKNRTRLERAENYHAIHVGDSINVVPFKNCGNESVGRGLFFRFMPSTCVLTITIHFTVLKKAAHVRRALRERHVTTVHSDDEMSSVSTDNEIEDNDVNSIATDEGNVWPLHYDTEINSSRISCIDIANRRVTTENGGIYSFEEAINYFSLLIS
jgi:hypothetical protein